MLIGLISGCQTQTAKPANTASSLPASQISSQKASVITEKSVRDFISKYYDASHNLNWREVSNMMSDDYSGTARGKGVVGVRTLYKKDAIELLKTVKSLNMKPISHNESNMRISCIPLH